MTGGGRKHRRIRQGERDGTVPAHTQSRDPAMTSVCIGAIALIDVGDNIAGDVVIVVLPRDTVRFRALFSYRVGATACQVGEAVPGGVPPVVAVGHDHNRLGTTG